MCSATSYGRALAFASPELRADRDVVLAAVFNEGGALFSASPELQMDRKVVLTAVSNDGYAFQHLPLRFHADREIVLAAVSSYGHALAFASTELQADREVVHLAVSSPFSLIDVDGDDILQYASDELQQDPCLQSWNKLTAVQKGWRKLREYVRVLHPIGIYWYQQSMRAHFAPDGLTAHMVGHGAKRALEEAAEEWGFVEVQP